MPSKKSFIVIGLAALSGVPLLWSLSAEAKQISCGIMNNYDNQELGLFMFSPVKHSVQCTDLGMTVAGRTRMHSSDPEGLQVSLVTASGTTSGANATAFGYDQSQQSIPGCQVSDTVAGGFTNLYCSDTVKYVILSASGSAP